jgi:Zn-dependent protease with chaperone function
MDFFAEQERARRQSKRLLMLFALAVVAIVVAINLVVVGLAEFGRDPGELTDGTIWSRNAPIFIVVSILVVLVIGIASLVRIIRLRGGGGVVARGMGGTLVSMDTGNPAHRRLRNVVEEIAIASGVPVPEIYVLEHEEAINAFAAGYAPADAAVAVTRGALEKLSRAELQGVIAHEFSHVLNGDMRLNIRLMGVLFGILVIGVIGREVLLRARGGGRDGAALIMIALGITIIGYVGLFFGRLIKAGVSRQREFLADASAVQFTRQGDGIAGALKKIAALPAGSKLEAADTEEVSHMLFGDGVGYSALFATHPPLVERIRRIDRSFKPEELKGLRTSMAEPMAYDDDESLVVGLAAGASAGATAAAPARQRSRPGPASRALPTATQSVRIEPNQVSRQIANPAVDDYITAGALARAIPDALVDAAHAEASAADLVLVLALDFAPAVRGLQFAAIEDVLGPIVRARVEVLADLAADLHPMHRLPLAAMAFPALRRYAAGAVERVLAALDAVVMVDGKVHLNEYCLSRLIRQQLAEARDPQRVRVAGKRKLADCRAEIESLLAILAEVGQDDAESARRAFQTGIAGLFAGGAAAYAPPQDWIAALDRALPLLDELNGPSKQLLLEALVNVMSHDQRVRVAEAELLRTICASLHCPLPPQLSV